MNKVVIGNIVACIGCVLFFISIKMKKQKQICIVQTIECILTGTATLILGGLIGALTTYICAIRNFLGVWELNGKICTVLSMISVGFLTIYTYSSPLDFLPLLATLIYTICLSFKSAKITKIGIIPNALLWGIYAFCINSYINVIFNVLNIVFCIYDLKKHNYED